MPIDTRDVDCLLQERIGLLGFGLEGRATLDYLRNDGYTKPITIFTDQACDVPDNCIARQSAAALSDIDLLIRSPGFSPMHDLRKAADALQLRQTTASNLFLSALRAHELPVITLTGSKGKSTTSMLCHLMLLESGVDSVLVGNIGKPALAELPAILARGSTTVMELSSYQCSDLTPGTGGSLTAVLDLFPEHLDWHGNAEQYFKDKLRIVSATRSDKGVYLSTQAAEQYRHYFDKAPFSVLGQVEHWSIQGDSFCYQGQALINAQTMRLRGTHNRFNALAAITLATGAGASVDACTRVLATFEGLDYRLQDEGMHGKVQWINDSLSTTPETVLAALQALPEVNTLIVGGFDRGYALEALCVCLQQLDLQIILLPDTGWKMQPMLSQSATHLVDNLRAAVSLAKQLSPDNGLCLFSPGAPSYNQYASFAERGQHFRELIAAL